MKNIFALAIAVCALAPLGHAAELAVATADDALTITSMEPGSTVALLGVARVPTYYMSRVVVTRELLVDRDRNGTERFAPVGGVPVSSLWILVDIQSGATAVVTREQVPAMVMRQRGAGQGKALDAVAATIEVGRNAVDLLVVRPGTGAWVAAARDGGQGDRDGKVNGRLRLDISTLEPLGSTSAKAPTVLQNGDVVAAIDADTMEYLLAAGRGDQ